MLKPLAGIALRNWPHLQTPLKLDRNRALFTDNVQLLRGGHLRATSKRVERLLSDAVSSTNTDKNPIGSSPLPSDSEPSPAILPRTGRKAELEAHKQPYLPTLIWREQEVLRLLTLRLTDKEIAQQLGIETSTVNSHVHHLLAKSGCHSRRDLATCALAAELRGTAPSALALSTGGEQIRNNSDRP